MSRFNLPPPGGHDPRSRAARQLGLAADLMALAVIIILIIALMRR